jgi:hypothetical protein
MEFWGGCEFGDGLGDVSGLDHCVFCGEGSAGRLGCWCKDEGSDVVDCDPWIFWV